jgi:hypothetical protein
MAPKSLLRKVAALTDTKAYHRVQHGAHGAYLSFAIVHYEGVLVIAASVALVVVVVSFIKGEAE